MSFLLHFVGFIVFTAGMGWIATLLGVPQLYILAGAGALLCVGLVTAISRSRAPQ